MEYLDICCLIPKYFWIFQVSFCYWCLILVLIKEHILNDFYTFLKIYFMTQHMICLGSSDINQVTLLNSIVQVFHILILFLVIIAVINKGELKFPTIIVDLSVSHGSVRFVSCILKLYAYKNSWCLIYELNRLSFWNVFISGYVFSWSQLYLKLICHSNLFIINVYIGFLTTFIYPLWSFVLLL